MWQLPNHFLLRFHVWNDFQASSMMSSGDSDFSSFLKVRWFLFSKSKLWLIANVITHSLTYLNSSIILSTFWVENWCLLRQIWRLWQFNESSVGDWRSSSHFLWPEFYLELQRLAFKNSWIWNCYALSLINV